jgi:hypothetical protein
MVTSSLLRSILPMICMAFLSALASIGDGSIAVPTILLNAAAIVAFQLAIGHAGEPHTPKTRRRPPRARPLPRIFHRRATRTTAWGAF